MKCLTTYFPTQNFAPQYAVLTLDSKTFLSSDSITPLKIIKSPKELLFIWDISTDISYII